MDFGCSDNFIKKIQASLLDFGANIHESEFVVGVSGGRDSVALLHALNKLNLKIHVAHVNHNSRLESDSDEKFVRELCAKLGVRCSTTKLSAVPEGENPEAWWSRSRYEFFEKCQNSNPNSFILTAHHRRDQAETLLMRVLSGRLSSNAKCIAKNLADKKIIRPMLDVSDEEISAYIEENRLNFVSDASNFDVRLTRSFIRHNLLKTIRERLNVSIDKTLSVLSNRLTADEEFFQEEVIKYFEENKGVHLSNLISMQAALSWRVLRQEALKQVGEVALKLGYEALNSLVPRLVSFGTVDIGFKIRVSLDEDRVVFQDLSKLSSPEFFLESLNAPGSFKHEFSSKGFLKFKAEVIEVESFDEIDFSNARMSDETSYYDLDSFESSKLTVRTRLDGDELRVWKRGRRKLKKLFQETSLPQLKRSFSPIVECDGRIIWVPGIARSDDAPISSKTRRILKLTCQSDLNF